MNAATRFIAYAPVFFSFFYRSSNVRPALPVGKKGNPFAVHHQRPPSCFLPAPHSARSDGSSDWSVMMNDPTSTPGRRRAYAAID